MTLRREPATSSSRAGSHTLLLANVPVLDAAHENAARRFIALVDELYDRNVNLIVSAAAAPGEFYRGEKLKFEFRRTSSRLVEMQTETYLARPHRPRARCRARPRDVAAARSRIQCRPRRPEFLECKSSIRQLPPPCTD